MSTLIGAPAVSRVSMACRYDIALKVFRKPSVAFFCSSVNTLASAARYGQDPRITLKRDELRALLTPTFLRDAARKYLDESRYVQVRLLPES